jgi:CRP-like cAMP-binding protein
VAEEFRDKTPLVRMELKRVDLVDYVQADVRLRGSGLLRELNDATMAELLQDCKLRRFSPRTMLFDQADQGSSLFWVIKGEAWLARRVDDELVDLGPVQRGEVFGEAEALGETDARPWIARASGELDVAEFPREVVKGIGAKAPALLGYLQKVKARRSATQSEMLNFLQRW